jgi:hypothetical protein
VRHGCDIGARAAFLEVYARAVADWDTVRAIGATLPDVAESTWYGTPALKAKDKAMCRLRDEAATLVVRVGDLAERELLLRSDPDVFFTLPHYDGAPYVLVRLAAVSRETLADLLEDARAVVLA